MNNGRINICAHGNPLSPRTWSGTSSSICNILSKKNKLGSTIDFTLHPLVRKPIYLLSRMYYHQSVELNRGLLIKIARSAYVALHLPLNKTSKTLHVSNMALPLVLKFNKQNQYLLTDSTWNLWSKHSDFKEQYSSRFYRDVEMLENKMYGQLLHIFALSEYVKSNLIDHYKIPESKITVVRTGIGSVEPFFGEKDYSQYDILFVANKRFNDKGGPILLKAFDIAVKILPGIKLHIVGIDKNQVHYNESAHRNIIFHGFTKYEELQTLFNTCSLFAMPALNEPWGLVYLEALACKCPILGYNAHAFPELCDNGKYGFILKDYSPISLAKLLIDAFSDTERLKNMGINGQAFVLKNFSWEIVVDKILTVINEE